MLRIRSIYRQPEGYCPYAVRTAKFVARKQWIVTGSDDMFIRVYNYNTMDKVKAFEAHTDYIRQAQHDSSTLSMWQLLCHSSCPAAAQARDAGWQTAHNLHGLGLHCSDSDWHGCAEQGRGTAKACCKVLATYNIYSAQIAGNFSRCNGATD